MRLNRARDDRKTAHLQGSMRVSDHWIRITLVNVSATGLMARCAQPPEVGAEVELQRRGLTIKGLVVWSTASRFGLRSFDPIDREALFAASDLQADRRAGARAEVPRRNEPRWDPRIGETAEGTSEPLGDVRAVDRRSNRRRIAQKMVEARSNGRAFTIELSDVSTKGCMVHCAKVGLAEGDRITFKFIDQIRVTGQVAWVQAGTAGVQFDNPMHEAIAEHLGVQTTEPLPPVKPTDHFGRAVPALRAQKRRLL